MFGAGPTGTEAWAPPPQVGQLDGATYEAGATVDVVQLEQLPHGAAHVAHGDVQPVLQTGRNTTWRINVTGRAHVVHAGA